MITMFKRLLLGVILSLAPISVYAETAKMADSFVDSIGVNTHFNYNGTVWTTSTSQLQTGLGTIGIRHVRDAPSGSGGVQLGVQQYMDAHLPVKFQWDFVEFDPNFCANNGVVQALTVLQWTDASHIASFEGQNEPNLRGCTTPTWQTASRTLQTHLWNAVKGSSTIVNVPIIGPSIVCSAGQTDCVNQNTSLGNMSAIENVSNVHDYQCDGSGCNMMPSVNNWMLAATSPQGASSVQVTETGEWSQNAADTTATETLFGKLFSRLWFEFYNAGATRTYKYELVDDSADDGAWFGFLRSDFTLKPEATAIKNIIGLLSDPGTSFTPGTLNYSIAGIPSQVHHTLLQKRNGKFYLILWQEVDSRAGSPSNVPLTVTLGTTASVNQYNPISSATPFSSDTNVTSEAVSVPDQALILEITPTLSGGPLSINSGGPAASPFVADVDYTGGSTASNNPSGAVDTSLVTNPAPTAVYRTERYGNPFSYTIPGLVAGGAYTVRLHFTEDYDTAVGGRIMNVTINGTQVLTNFDIFAQTGAQHKAIAETFTANANTSGQIVISFAPTTASIDQAAKVDGIVITYSPNAPPSVPTNLVATPASTTQVNLSWTASTDADMDVAGYKIYRNGAQVGTSTTTSFSDTGLASDTVYSYTVSSYDDVAMGSAQTAAVIAITNDGTSAIAVGNTVDTTSLVDVRSTASITGTKLGTQPQAALGTIASGPTVANGYTWWNVTFNTGVSGWVIAPYLSKVYSGGPVG